MKNHHREDKSLELRGPMESASLIHLMVTGGEGRPTRFHDEHGNRVPLAGIGYAPHAFITTFLRVFFGYHPSIPWLSYRAQHQISHIIRPDSIVLEFGSGMSTPWLAQRCGLLYSIEHNEAWYRIVQARLSAKRMTNVHYYLRDQTSYSDLTAHPDHLFDFVLIDGIERPACVLNAVIKLKKGGWIYLDNTDRMARVKPESDFQKAERLLLDIVRRCQGTVRYYTDFVPTNFVAKQGMLVQLP